MNPATAPTLTTALVWTDMPDAMVVREHHYIRARITKAWVVKNQINDQT